MIQNKEDRYLTPNEFKFWVKIVREIFKDKDTEHDDIEFIVSYYQLEIRDFYNSLLEAWCK